MKNDRLITKIEDTFSRNSDIRKLLIDTCQIISESGDYSLCWIGIMDEITGRIKAIPECISNQEYSEVIKMSLRSGLPSDSIFSVGNYYVNNNIWEDPVFKEWLEIPVLSRFNSITIFPVVQHTKTIGAVYIYSEDKGFFKHEELMLLQILAMNLSLALDKIEITPREYIIQPNLSDVIKDLKRQNEKLLISREKAEELIRLKASFLTNMGHKLRTPLNSIMGFAELLSNSDNTADERQEFSQIIITQSNRLLQHIDNLLQISNFEARVVPLNKETVLLNDILDDLYNIYSVKLESLKKNKIELICNKAPSESQFEITTDILKFRQIFSNLLDNSIKFTDSGGIVFGYHSHDEDVLKCFVSDTGVGINIKEKPELFDIFTHAAEMSKRNYGETGLGLAVCKGNAQLLGGDIWVESVRNKGATFTFTLKYSSIESSIAQKEISKLKTLHWNTRKILLVEDDDCTIQFLTKILEIAGFSLFVAHDKKEAELLFQNLSEIDLVLLDMSLPDTSGLDLAKQIKIIRKDIPVIAQTALTVEDNGKQFMEAGCDGYITKPYRSEQVLAAINSYMSA